MSAIYGISTSGRGHQDRRLATRALREVSERIETVAVAAILATVVAAVFDLGPVDRLTGYHLVVGALALWGLAKVIGEMADDVADMVDPDARDGDILWATALTLQQVTADLRAGANKDDVRIALQTSKLLPALHDAVADLQRSYESDGEQEEATSLGVTADYLGCAARSLGHQR